MSKVTYTQYLLKHYNSLLETKRELRGYYLMLGNIKAASVVSIEISNIEGKLAKLKESL